MSSTVEALRNKNEQVLGVSDHLWRVILESDEDNSSLKTVSISIADVQRELQKPRKGIGTTLNLISTLKHEDYYFEREFRSLEEQNHNYFDQQQILKPGTQSQNCILMSNLNGLEIYISYFEVGCSRRVKRQVVAIDIKRNEALVVYEQQAEKFDTDTLTFVNQVIVKTASVSSDRQLSWEISRKLQHENNKQDSE